MKRGPYKKDSRTTRWRKKKTTAVGPIVNNSSSEEDEISASESGQINAEPGPVEVANTIQAAVLEDQAENSGQELDYDLLHEDSSESKEVGDESSGDENGDVYFDAEDNDSGDDYFNFDFCFDESQKIYDGSNISVKESALMLLSFFIHFKLSYSCMQKVIELIIAHLPPGNRVIKSMYLVRKYLAKETAIYIRKWHCKNCKQLIDDGQVCKNLNCAQSDTSNFLIFPIETQLRNLFQRSDIRDMLLKTFNMKQRNNQFITDIYQGSIYKKFSEFFNTSPNNISFSYYTDGVQIFKSAKSSVWPMFFSINELPYDKRFLPENIVLGGLWFDGTKPDFSIFLRPLYDTFQRLHNGVKVRIMHMNSEVITVKCILLSGVADLPAKALLVNMKHFNGYYGCPKCLCQGDMHNFGGGKRKVFVFPYPKTPLVLRDTASTMQYAEQAHASKKVVYGIKGITILSKLVPDFVNSLGVDMMHALCSGAGGKKFLELWFGKEFKNREFSMFEHLDEVDTRLTNIRPPSYIKRSPRPVATHFALYKSSEFKNWFFYFSIPVLYGIMTIKQLKHYTLLVQALFLLCQSTITIENIEKARGLINKFASEYEIMYGREFMSANLHSLLHLCDNVLALGPLYVTSCFPLEELNGKMKRLVSGSRYCELKIAESFYTLQSLPKYISNISKDSTALQFIKNIKSNNFKILEKIDNLSFTVGTYKEISIITDLMSTAFQNINITQGVTPWLFFRMFRDKTLFTSRSYQRMGKSLSYCVTYGDNCNIGLIEYYVKLSHCQCKVPICNCASDFYAVIQNCISLPIDGLEEVTFVTELELADKYTAIMYNEINSLCVLSRVNDKLFCAKRLNNVEAE